MSASATAQDTLRAVIFDMDGVLCNTDELHYQSWEQAVCGYDIPFDRQINHKLRGLTRSDSLNVILGERHLSPEERQAILDTKNQIYIHLLDSIGPENLLPGVMRLIL
jgi:beta-phosphoglucomutase